MAYLTKTFITAIMLLAPTVLASTTSYQTIQIPPKVLTVSELITLKSEEYSVSETLMEGIIQCESHASTTVVGDFGHSFGLVQIFLPAHPEVTREQALSPEFAVDFLAKNLALGRGYWWTCWRIIVRG